MLIRSRTKTAPPRQANQNIDFQSVRQTGMSAFLSSVQGAQFQGSSWRQTVGATGMSATSKSAAKRKPGTEREGYEKTRLGYSASPLNVPG